MLFRQMTYFCAVVDHGGFTRAAEACYVSQSAISQQVKALEAELGCALLVRAGRGFTLTPAGEAFHRRAREILADVEELKLEVLDIASGAPRALRVGYLNRYDGWEVQAAVAAFARRHPHVEIAAEGMSHEGLYEGARAGALDILVSDRRRELSDTFENRLLFRSYEMVEVSEANALAACDDLRVSQLRGQACILVSDAEQRAAERSYFRDVLNYDCEFLFAPSLEQARMMVAGNRGVLPVESRMKEAGSGTVLRRIPLVDGSGARRRREYYAFWPKARGGALVEEFAAILEDLFR